MKTQLTTYYKNGREKSEILDLDEALLRMDLSARDGAVARQVIEPV